MKIIIIISSLLLSACASTSDIDLSRIESICGQKCSKNYSECLGGFSFFPIQRQNECTSAFRICANSCPLRNIPVTTESKQTTTEKIKELNNMLETGLINKKEYKIKKQQILKSM